MKRITEQQQASISTSFFASHCLVTFQTPDLYILTTYTEVLQVLVYDLNAAGEFDKNLWHSNRRSGCLSAPITNIKFLCVPLHWISLETFLKLFLHLNSTSSLRPVLIHEWTPVHYIYSSLSFCRCHYSALFYSLPHWSRCTKTIVTSKLSGGIQIPTVDSSTWKCQITTLHT